MKSADLRDATFASLSRDWLTGARQTLYADLLARGPATTRDMAVRTGISLLTVRPRVTELQQLGLVALEKAAGREGVYSAVTEARWQPPGANHQMILL